MDRLLRGCHPAVSFSYFALVIACAMFFMHPLCLALSLLGAGCCAAVLCAHILPKLLRRGSRRVLFLATGALMSQTTFLQKESIPAVAHLVELTAPEKEG